MEEPNNNSELFGRAVELGEYCLSIFEARVAVLGPSRTRASRAEERLLELLRSEAGARLVAEALCGNRKSEDDEIVRLASALELPDPRVPGFGSAENLEPDEDAAHIRELRLPDLCKRWIDELQGMCAAIVADGKLADGEIALIDSWMSRSAEASGMWPVAELREILLEIRRDGVVTSGERGRLLRFLQSIAAIPVRRGEPADSIFEANPSIEFAGRSFLFTGKLEVCSRKGAWEHVKSLGGTATDSPSRRVSYLIVGDLGSELWRHSRYGRKIQAIMEWKRRGSSITIAREAAFIAALRDAGALSSARRLPPEERAFINNPLAADANAGLGPGQCKRRA